jgi:glycerophosphoryl diester phosphodiesterase
VLSLARREGRPLCIGHRGAADVAPENTLRAFRAAVAAGADLVEFDVLQLDSGQLVVAHSDDLHEVSHGAARGTVTNQTLQALREVAPELPTLDEALQFFVDEAPETGVHVDLKARGAGEEVIAALRRFGLVERTLLSSFHVGTLRRVAVHAPDLRIGVSFPRDRLRVSRRRGSTPVIRVGLSGLRPIAPAFAYALLARSGASALVLHHAIVGSRVVRAAEARGIPVVAWTVERRRDYERLDGVGVHAVVVNNPAMFVSKLAA